MKPRVLLADDHTLVLAGFVKLLEDSCEVVGLVEDGRALLDAAQHLQPDIAIVDISMPLLNGIEACSRVRAASPQTKLIIVTMHAAMPYVQAAFKAGAAGYVLKRSATDELLQAIRTVRSGNYYVTPLMTKEVVNVLVKGPSDSNASLDDLSTRQREILQLVAEGYTVKEIAGQLGLSPRTVEFHKGRTMQQLQVRSTAELVKYAIAHALIVPT
ncbi:DNA-binding response regulator [Nitrospira tepida]|uniref:DNA-binding response regulator n=1 Tax=Nitrospira tepida TaxID=2973512 RepID=A0AA86MZP0_9BACT|nr:response regulator transcription factor [Nitrospira tepida]CAI4032048.1 DNA-binding response regulator [Nitrospira tepida]